MNRFPDPNSVVDTLKSHGCPSSYDYRKNLYESNYGGHYTGSASQNIRMNNDLKDYFNYY